MGNKINMMHYDQEMTVVKRIFDDYALVNIADIKKTDNDDKFKVYATFYGIGIIQLIKDGFKIESGELVALEKVKEEVIYMGNLPKFFVIKIRSPRNKSKFTLKRIIIKKV